MQKRYVILSSLLFFIFSCGKTNKIWVEGFKKERPMTTKRSGAAGIITSGHIYMIGGIDGNDFLNTSERAKIHPDGSIGPWLESKTLNHKRGFFYAVEHNGFLYVLGGANGKNGKNLLNSVERAKIHPDGSLGDWIEEPHLMNSVRRCSKAVLINGYIYAIGGYNGSFIQYAERSKINPDGSLGKWELEENPTLIGRYIHSVGKKENTIFVVGGHNETKGEGIDSIEWTSTDELGKLKKWQKSRNTLLLKRYGHSSFIHNNFLYAVGGLNGHLFMKSVEFTNISAKGKTGKWKFTAPLMQTRESVVSLVDKNNLYILGGSSMEKGFLQSVERAEFNEDGSLGYWASLEEKTLLLKEKKASLYKNRLIISDFLEYYNEAIAYEKKGLLLDAEKMYKKVLTVNEGFIESYQNLSSVYLRLKRYNNAYILIDKGLAIQKNNFSLHYNKACAFSLENKRDDAINSLTLAVKNGLLDIKLLESDPDLKNIRNTPGFKNILLKLITK